MGLGGGQEPSPRPAKGAKPRSEEEQKKPQALPVGSPWSLGGDGGRVPVTGQRFGRT